MGSVAKGFNVEHLFSFVPTFLDIYGDTRASELKQPFLRLAEKFAFDSYMLLFDLGYGFNFCVKHFPDISLKVLIFFPFPVLY